ncbi:MAG: Gfo/Idh/MocA family oxidoreductase [Verrucomicrobiota bacterium]
MNRIKIGQIGICHEHAGAKMDALRRLPEVFEIVGVVDDRATSAARFAGDDVTPYDGLTWMTEEQLRQVPGLQAVTVETPNDDLVSTALRCLELGLPMHLDKPGGEDLALFRRLLAGCSERQLPLQMGYMFRHNPAMQFCRRALREDWLGGIFELQASMSHDYGGEPYQRYLAQFRGGIMFNLGCHLIDFVVALMGRPEQVTPILKSAPGYEDTVHNNALAVLEYPHATATLRACSLEVDGLNRRSLKICGTKGTLELSPLERFDGRPLLLTMTLREPNDSYPAGTHTVDCGIQEDRYVDQLLEFARIIRGETTNPYTYEHDDLAQEVLLAASDITKWRN